MQSNLVRCFEKHSFEELNNLDINVFELCNPVIDSLDKSGVFIDIGCNAGSFIKYLLNKNITNVHAFEPHPVLSEKVRVTYPHVKMNEYCLADTNGMVDIHIPTHSVGLSSLIRRPVFDKLEQEITVLNVKSETLDTYCEKNNINKIQFIKIDVEGAEYLIFKGAKELLKNKKIKCGIFEIGQTLTDANTSENEICSYLKSYGYETYRLNEDNIFFVSN
jgi:FkbM family methyltransferase